MSEPRGLIVPVHARHDQAVDIHWRLADGSIYVERRNAPLLPITDATWKALRADGHESTDGSLWYPLKTQET